MFTGIVDHYGEIIAIRSQSQAGIELQVASQFNDLTLGESMSVDGCCLTVMRIEDKTFYCECSPETRMLTIAKHYQLGTFVNLERPLRFSDRLGGHIVTGHVDQTIRVVEKKTHDEFIEFRFGEVEPYGLNLVSKKGSVAINGVSLTVNEVKGNHFSLMLIPHTLQRTNLAKLNVGSPVNLEYDWLAKQFKQQFNAYIEEVQP